MARMLLKDRKRAFIDVETTGLNPSHHEIIEFAAYLPDQRSLAIKIRPQHIGTAEFEALKVNGYGETKWKNAFSIKEALPLIVAALQDRVVFAYNAKFDVGFLHMAVQQAGVKVPYFCHPAIDVMALAYEHLAPLGIKGLSLKDVCRFLGIQPEPYVHEALNGAVACAAVYESLSRAGLIKRLWWRTRNRLPFPIPIGDDVPLLAPGSVLRCGY